MLKPRVLIVLPTHPCCAPRVFKEALALSRNYEVTVGCVWFDDHLVERDKTLLGANITWNLHPILDFRKQNYLSNFKSRCLSKLSRLTFRFTGLFTSGVLGYGVDKLLQFSLKFQASITIVHLEAGLWVGSELLKRGYQVGVDFEDWYSEDLLEVQRVNRPISQLKSLEAYLIRQCRYCLTTSYVMAETLQKEYQATRKPTVIYNSFPWIERKQIDGKVVDRKDLNLPSLHWFSQTIGPGRGLEILFQALAYIDSEIEIHLRGNCPAGYHTWLEEQAPLHWRSNIFIHPTVPHQALLSRIAEHDIGLALERSDIPSRNYTITNKLFQYMQGGLAIITTDTAGQREVFERFPAIGRLIACNDAFGLAQAVSSLLKEPQALFAAKTASLEAARQLSWENQEVSLIAALDRALAV